MFPEFVGCNAVTLFEYFYVVSKVFVSYHFCDFILFIFIILQEGVKMQEADVRDFCRNKISRYKIPKYIFFVNEFPMTGSGKIQKFRLKDLGLQLCKEQGIEII